MQAAFPVRSRSKSFVAIFLLLDALLISCNQPFDPRGPLDSRLVVFSVLSTDRIIQFARVERSYLPTGFDATTYTADNFVPNSLVTIQETNSTYTLRDTTFPRRDTTRYKFPIRAYFSKPLAIGYGTTYQIIVRSPQFESAAASIRVPSKPFIVLAPSSFAVLDSPELHEPADEITYTLTMGSAAKGWIGRLHLYYRVMKAGIWVEERIEIPVYYIFPKVFSEIAYGQMTRTVANYKTAAVYKNERYSQAVNQIKYEKYPNSKITFTRAVFGLVQVEENLYNYYEVAHGSFDALSVRLDDPMYTNLAGGTGVVGAYTLDSLVQILPTDFGGNRQ